MGPRSLPSGAFGAGQPPRGRDVPPAGAVEEHWSLRSLYIRWDITFNTIGETLIPITSKKSGWVFAYFFDQGCAMPSYKEAVKLAKEYALSARLAFTKQGAAEAWAMAKKYQDEAAKLDRGGKPDIGPLPPLLKRD